MVSLGVRYLFSQLADDKIKIWTHRFSFAFLSKKTQIWEKASFEYPIGSPVSIP